MMMEFERIKSLEGFGIFERFNDYPIGGEIPQ